MKLVAATILATMIASCMLKGRVHSGRFQISCRRSDIQFDIDRAAPVPREWDNANTWIVGKQGSACENSETLQPRKKMPQGSRSDI